MLNSRNDSFGHLKRSSSSSESSIRKYIGRKLSSRSQSLSISSRSSSSTSIRNSLTNKSKSRSKSQSPSISFSTASSDNILNKSLPLNYNAGIIINELTIIL